jgi:hypothetical protein
MSITSERVTRILESVADLRYAPELRHRKAAQCVIGTSVFIRKRLGKLEEFHR